MFSNYPLVLQLFGWGMFMGLNGYIGAACPGVNLAVLAFAGMFATHKSGYTFLAAAVVITLAESVWFYFVALGHAMGSAKIPPFIGTGAGIINLVLAAVAGFMLWKQFSGSFPAPQGFTKTIVIFCYIVGAVLGVLFWAPLYTHKFVLLAAGWMLLLCFPASAPFGLVVGLLFTLLLARFIVHEYQVGRRSHLEMKQHEEFVTEFLQAVTDNQQEKIAALWGETNESLKKDALYIALDSEDKTLLPFLIRQGAPTYDLVQDILRHSKDYDTLRKLIDNGAVISPYAVSDVAKYKDLSLLQYLVEHGADINANPDTPLAAATEKGRIEVVKYLLQTGKNTQKTLDSALLKLGTSIESKTIRAEILQLLLKHGARANAYYDDWWKTPLISLILGDGHNPFNLPLIQSLLAHGADVNKVTKEGRTALSTAVSYGNLEIATFLLEHGAAQSLHQPDEKGRTPLFGAYDLKMAQLLLKYGAKTSHQDQNGQTPLIYFAGSNFNETAEIVQLLLDHAADVNVTDKNGKTALWHAQNNHNLAHAKDRVVEMLKQHGAQ